MSGDMEKSVRVLILEDSAADAKLAVRSLERGGFTVSSHRVKKLAQLEAAIEESGWDLVISDHKLPEFGALLALERVRRALPEVPFILVTGAIGEETAVNLIKAGAADHVMKTRLWRLPLAANQALREVRARRNERAAQARAEQATRVREQVLAVVSHDMKNPLSAIDLNHQLIERMLATPVAPAALAERDRQIRIRLERARRSTQRMKSLITDILDQAKIESGRFHMQIKRARAEDLLSEVVEMLQHQAVQKAITLRTSSPDEPAWGDFDHERIFQVLANLVGNAIKFTPTGGRIEIELRLKPEEIRFRVIDSGPGVPEEHRSLIFERFWQLNEATQQGVGLGLAIAKGIVEAHQGKIHVESAESGGSCFEFYIPRWRAELVPESVESSPEMDATTAGIEPILLIDDDEDLRQVVEDTLVSHGYCVQAVADAESGLRLLESMTKPPSLVVLDYSLPGMNGAQFLARLRGLPGELGKVPVLLSSGERDLTEKARQLSVQGVLRKPATLPDLLKTVDDVLRSH